MPTQEQKDAFDALTLVEQEQLELECEELERNTGTSERFPIQATVHEATVSTQE